VKTDRPCKVAYVFDPLEDAGSEGRPSKKRRISKKQTKADAQPVATTPTFQALLDGAENEHCVRSRQKLFTEAWSKINERIQVCD
jgi:hypothetical protein